MCLSRLGQIIYGVLAFAAVALIAASMFTPAWQKLDVDAGSLFKGDWKKVKFGLFACQFPNNTGAGQATTTTSTTNFAATSTTTSTSNNTSRGGSAQKTGENSQSSNSFDEELEFCKIWFDHLPTHKKVVIVAMILALGTSLLAFVWNILSFCACFCKGHAMKPLPFLAGLTTLLLITALAIFYYTYQTDIEQLRKNAQQKVLPDQSDKNDVVETIEKIWNLTKELKDGGNQVSYSFWLACGAVVASFANLIVGSLIVCLADKCL